MGGVSGGRGGGGVISGMTIETRTLELSLQLWCVVIFGP